MSVYSDRIQTLASALEQNVAFTVAGDAAGATLTLMDELSENPNLAIRSNWATMVEAWLTELPAALRAGDSALMEWATGASQAIRETLRQAVDNGTGGLREDLERASTHYQRVASARDIERITRRAEQALDDTIEARDSAKDAAGETGAASLAHYFQEYARTEGLRATGFRWASIFAILTAVGLAVFLPHQTTGFLILPEGELGSAIYRVAILAGVGGLAAYFGRLSGHHRRTHNWAKSIEVQLNSFPAFMMAAPDDDKGEVFRAFARRVLGHPPEKGVDTPDESLPASQLVDLIAAVARRQS